MAAISVRSVLASLLCSSAQCARPLASISVLSVHRARQPVQIDKSADALFADCWEISGLRSKETLTVFG